MDLFSLRESEIFTALNSLRGIDFTVIGGYAVNAYALPRFSVDCDIVVKNQAVAKKISAVLKRSGYVVALEKASQSYTGSFMRLEKTLPNKFIVSFDVLVGGVLDRNTNAFFTSEWVFKNSSVISLVGKTVGKSLSLRIVTPEALVVLKLVCGRISDLRDVFMLLPLVNDNAAIKTEVGKQIDFKSAVEKAGKQVLSPAFKNNLQGVFGYLDEKTFAKHADAFKKLKELANN